MSGDLSLIGDGDNGQELIAAYGGGTWPDIDHIDYSGRVERAVLLPNGTTNGNASVEILVRLEDGRTVHANTTLCLWLSATELFKHWHENK